MTVNIICHTHENIQYITMVSLTYNLVQLQKLDPVYCLQTLGFDKFVLVIMTEHYLLSYLVKARHSKHCVVLKFDHHALTISR